MPLTFSHPAIVLPLSYLPKRWVSLTGLITGSVAPDFEYFFRMKVLSIYSHTWLGLLWFNLPVGLLVAFVYHDVVKQQFIINLPFKIKSRLALYQSFNWDRYFVQNMVIVIISILIGGVSHLFWDSFTHITGYFVMRWDMAKSISIFSLSIPFYKIVQHASTVIGAIAIVIAIFKMPQNNFMQVQKIISYWLIVFAVILLTIMSRVAFGLNLHQYWNVLVTAISGMLLGLIAASLTSRSVT